MEERKNEVIRHGRSYGFRGKAIPAPPGTKCKGHIPYHELLERRRWWRFTAVVTAVALAAGIAIGIGINRFLL